MLFNKDTEEILGVHIIGLHAADLIQECANAMAAGSTVRDVAYMVSSSRLRQASHLAVFVIEYERFEAD